MRTHSHLGAIYLGIVFTSRHSITYSGADSGLVWWWAGLIITGLHSHWNFFPRLWFVCAIPRVALFFFACGFTKCLTLGGGFMYLKNYFSVTLTRKRQRKMLFGRTADLVWEDFYPCRPIFFPPSEETGSKEAILTNQLTGMFVCFFLEVGWNHRNPRKPIQTCGKRAKLKESSPSSESNQSPWSCDVTTVPTDPKHYLCKKEENVFVKLEAS